MNYGGNPGQHPPPGGMGGYYDSTSFPPGAGQGGSYPSGPFWSHVPAPGAGVGGAFLAQTTQPPQLYQPPQQYPSLPQQSGDQHGQPLAPAEELAMLRTLFSMNAGFYSMPAGTMLPTAPPPPSQAVPVVQAELSPSLPAAPPHGSQVPSTHMSTLAAAPGAPPIVAHAPAAPVTVAHAPVAPVTVAAPAALGPAAPRTAVPITVSTATATPAIAASAPSNILSMSPGARTRSNMLAPVSRAGPSGDSGLAVRNRARRSGPPSSVARGRHGTNAEDDGEEDDDDEEDIEFLFAAGFKIVVLPSPRP